MKVVLIPCGSTEWGESGRLLGRTDMPLTPEGRAACAQWAEQFEGDRPARIMHSSDELAAESARAIAARLDIPTRAAEGLAEVDVGLWAGLTEDQLKTRYENAYKQLREAPLSVRPPEGENFGEAAERVAGALRKIMKRNGKGVTGLVMRPLALTLARCALEDLPASEIWTTSRKWTEPVVVESAGMDAPAAPARERV
jgi:broad specificity phosphatase PhoE